MDMYSMVTPCDLRSAITRNRISEFASERLEVGFVAK